MEQSEMEVDSSETMPEEKGETCTPTTPTLLAESAEIESSSQIIPSSQVDQTTSDTQADTSDKAKALSASNQGTSSQALPADQSNSSQAISSGQAEVSLDQATSSPVVPSDQAAQVASSDISTTLVASTQKAPSSVAGPSTETLISAAASKITNGPASKKARIDYDSMSTGVYLDSTVVPILHLALVTLDRLRPADPVQYVIDFLLRHKAQYSKKDQQATSASANQA